MGKGSNQRPGNGYQDNWEKIFGNKNNQPKDNQQKDNKKDEKQFCK